MSGPPMTSLRAILSRLTKSADTQGHYNAAEVLRFFVRIGSKVGYFISVACELFIGGIKLFIVYPIGLLVFCALVVAALDNDEAPDVRIVSGIIESAMSSLQGAPSGQMNLVQCDDLAVTMDMTHQACQNWIVKAVPLSEGIQVLASQLTDVFRLFYAMAVILVFGWTLMGFRMRAGHTKVLQGAIAKSPEHVGTLVGSSAVRSGIHKSDTQAGNTAKSAEAGQHSVTHQHPV